ncbi:MAG TPA: DUF2127 domain-containing protein [Candidatus Nanoarchaeia archaeon]|nr:DUF2127 domain-containing protein [Candidatus Nanoarchaeia archaeon]
MPIPRTSKKVDRIFEISILLKALDGAFEAIGGLLLLLVKPASINHFVIALTQRELVQDPRDFIANHLLHTAQKLTGASLIFGAIYLLSHGLVKVILVAEIMRDHLWAYKGLIIFVVAFMVYQIYRITYTHSIGLLLLTLYDGLVVYLTAKEYRRLTS